MKDNILIFFKKNFFKSTLARLTLVSRASVFFALGPCPLKTRSKALLKQVKLECNVSKEGIVEVKLCFRRA